MSLVNSPVLVLSAYAIIVAVGIILILKLSKDKTRKISTLRLFIQAAAVIIVFLGLIIGPFNQPNSLFYPLGISPRDHLIGADVLGNQFPDGISLPILACYYPNGRTVTCAIWQLQAYIFPFWNANVRGYEVYLLHFGVRKNSDSHWNACCGIHNFGKTILRLALPLRVISRPADEDPQIR